MNTNNKRRRRQVLVLPDYKKFVIDEDDYLVVREILSKPCDYHSKREWRKMVPRVARKIVDIPENDKERRVCKLKVPTGFAGALPSSVGTMASLACLDLNSSGITSIPPSIGHLKNLKDLDLSLTGQLRNLPEEIGDIASLSRLIIKYSSIASLPSSIGRLKNLKYLVISGNKKLVNLPEEIGDLVSLNTLTLEGSWVTSLPPSIGRLKCLIDLDLSWTHYRLLNLPKEIGDLVSLNNLNLQSSGISSLPSSIGRLTNLKKLNLSCTINLLNLPEEIGDLASLEILDLQYSIIGLSLPSSIGRLTNLKDLNLCRTTRLANLPVEILNLANLRCHFHDNYSTIGEESRVCTLCPIAKKLCYARAHKKAMSRTGLGVADNGSIRMSSKMWPLVLRNAKRAFKHRYNIYLELEQPDAIYQLICDGRESFIGVLLNRDSNRNLGPTI